MHDCVLNITTQPYTIMSCGGWNWS